MMVKMLDGIGKIVEGYNSVIAALENHRVEEIHIKEKNLQSKKIKDLIELADHKNINTVSYTHLTLPTILRV